MIKLYEEGIFLSGNEEIISKEEGIKKYSYDVCEAKKKTMAYKILTSHNTSDNDSALKIKFDCGYDDNGKTIVKSRTYSNVKGDAASQNVLDVARALANLCQHDVLEILKQDNTILN